MVTPTFYTQPDEAARALFRYVVANPGDFPDDMREKILSLLEPGNSISFAVSETAEMIYARQDEVPQGVIQLGAEMAMISAANRVNNFADDNGQRGAAIAQALRRASGEQAPVGVTWPDSADDPAPKAEFIPSDGQNAVPPVMSAAPADAEKSGAKENK